MTIESITTPMANATTWLAIACAAGALVALWRGRPALRGTTLIGAWSWAVAAIASLTAIELALSQSSNAGAPNWASPLRFAAACLTVCPTVAVLGAKRPQDKAWHWIVLSLWIVLCIPAANAAFFHPSGAVELHIAQSMFLAALILLGPASYLPTRCAASAVLVTAGQILLFAEQWPAAALEWTSHAWQIGVAAYALGIAASPLARRRRPDSGPDASLDAAWRDFRDSFGSFWALRVLTRLNAAAEMNRWPVLLGWSGFRPNEREPAGENAQTVALPAIRRSLHSMLRRFV